MLFADEESLYTTISSAPVGICILNADTLVAELVNDKFIAVAGKSSEAIIGNFYWDIFPEARGRYEDAMQGVVKNGEPFHANEVERAIERNGSKQKIYINLVYSPIKNKDGRVIKLAIWALEKTEDVIERKKEEASKLNFQQERDGLKSVFMQALAGICILQGPQLIYEMVNPAYQEILPGRNLAGRSIFEALPELVGTPVQTALLSVYKTGETFKMNEMLIPVAEYEGGPTRERYFNFSFQARRDHDGNIDGIVNFVFDVTELIKAQHKLREATEQADRQKRIYETITAGTPDLMYVWDLDYKFTYVNHALLKMWGKTWEQAIGRGFRDHGYEEWHATMHERETDRIVATKQPLRGEVAFPHAEFGKRIYDYILIPVLNEHGEVEAIAGTTRDVTERKIMEDELAKSSEELQAINEEMVATNEEQAASNEELLAANNQLALVNKELLDARKKIEESEVALRLAIEAADSGTYSINIRTMEFYASPRLKELYGFKSDEEPSLQALINQIREEYRQMANDMVEAAIIRGKRFDLTFPVTGFHDGKQRWLRSIGTYQQAGENSEAYFAGITNDVTEQKEDEQRKNDFIGMVSHELKTPLTSLTAIVQVANTKLKNSEDPFLAGAMGKANQQVKRMATMINGFLNVSRLESAKLLIDKKEFDLHDLVEEVVKEIAFTASTHTIKYNLCDHIMINADADKIGSVLTNLISNAIKYSPKGKDVEIKCGIENNKAVVSVTDEGIGLSPEDQAKVFDRYFRVESNNTRHISGFGIGLYLSAEIIRRHDGEIGVKSESGHGSTFYFSLPLV
ncbi:PAS domain-containing sensor histidine kinase [Mucilaginibacter auburnensis]|uniref:histidine kinase n=1 Tax=Mucilaginibacter auburnensis TaxID=1457233 RepID=A0A2H9VSS8_9SPHI|nr:PAS domain-containing protein [Mucilaginibacter auburnensis]PJJ83865.1 PAS domain S-box-containing protein [Mucilaginibacter auburnensis]